MDQVTEIKYQGWWAARLSPEQQFLQEETQMTEMNLGDISSEPTVPATAVRATTSTH